MEIVSNGNNSGSMSFNTLLTDSPSTNSSSDLDTQVISKTKINKY